MDEKKEVKCWEGRITSERECDNPGPPDLHKYRVLSAIYNTENTSGSEYGF